MIKKQYTRFTGNTNGPQLVQKSNETQSHKLDTYNSVVHRACTILMNHKDFIQKIKIIKQTAKSNEYKPKISSKLIHKHNMKSRIENLILPLKRNS